MQGKQVDSPFDWVPNLCFHACMSVNKGEIAVMCTTRSYSCISACWGKLTFSLNVSRKHETMSENSICCRLERRAWLVSELIVCLSVIISGHYSIWRVTAAFCCETIGEHRPLILHPGRGHISIFVMRKTGRAPCPSSLSTTKAAGPRRGCSLFEGEECYAKRETQKNNRKQ
jgi:hypothetical protein